MIDFHSTSALYSQTQTKKITKTQIDYETIFFNIGNLCNSLNRNH